MFNLKRILEKVPFGKSKIASYAAALFLIREETGMAEEDILKVLEDLGHNTSLDLNEEFKELHKGQHILNHDLQESNKGTIVLNGISDQDTASSQSSEIELLETGIVDFSESNPFGEF